MLPSPPARRHWPLATAPCCCPATPIVNSSVTPTHRAGVNRNSFRAMFLLLCDRSLLTCARSRGRLAQVRFRLLLALERGHLVRVEADHQIVDVIVNFLEPVARA